MTLSPLQLPPPLQPGDLLQVISPCGAIKEKGDLEAGVKVWRSRGYRLQFGLNYQNRYSYLAGNDLQRREDLAAAWQDPECKGILCARGGYGSARLLERWQWPATPTPKWLIGFSDVTGLLWSLATQGIASIHGPLLTTLGKEPFSSQQRLFAAVEGGSLPPLKGQGWGGGQGAGLLLPGNLAVATNLLGTSLQPSLANVILAWEDVGEAPYRLDRMITQWRMLGALQQVRGIALGRFSQCQGSQGSWTVEEMLRDRLRDLNIPLVAELPFGHDGENAALPVGQLVTIDGDEGILRSIKL